MSNNDFINSLEKKGGVIAIDAIVWNGKKVTVFACIKPGHHFETIGKHDLNCHPISLPTAHKKQNKNPAPHRPSDSEMQSFYFTDYRFFTIRHLIAFSTQITMTPTSANIASHMLAMPSAPRSRQASFTPMAK